MHLGAGDNHARGEKRDWGPRTSLSARCYWPRIDGTLRLRFNIFNELAYQRENRVETVAPPRAEYLLLPLSAGNVDRITHHSLNLPLTRFTICIYVKTARTLFAKTYDKDRRNVISRIILDKRKDIHICNKTICVKITFSFQFSSKSLSFSKLRVSVTVQKAVFHIHLIRKNARILYLRYYRNCILSHESNKIKKKKLLKYRA